MRAYYFTASWCAPCRDFEPIVKSVCAEKELDLYIYDVEEMASYTMGCKIKSTPTLIVQNSAGEEVYRIIGSIPVNELKEKLGGVMANG